MRTLVLLVGVLHLGSGLYMALAPRAFYDQLGTFPPFNAHYLRDLSTFYVALGVVLIVAARRRAWQVPLLTLAVVQYALHLANHLVDLGAPEPAWKGPATAAALAVALGLLWLLLRALRRRASRE